MPGGSNHNNDRREGVNPNRGFSPNKPRHYGSTKELVARAIHACGGVEEAMLVLDRSRSTVYEYTEETKPASHLSYDGARRLTRLAQVTVFAEDLAALAGGIFAPIARDDGASRTWSDLGGIATAEFAQFIQVLLRALNDSKIDARERARLKREVDDVIRIMAEARAKLESGES